MPEKGNVLPINGGCWYCHNDDGQMVQTIEFDAQVHPGCLKDRLEKPHDDDMETLYIARELADTIGKTPEEFQAKIDAYYARRMNPMLGEVDQPVFRQAVLGEPICEPAPGIVQADDEGFVPIRPTTADRFAEFAAKYMPPDVELKKLQVPPSMFKAEVRLGGGDGIPLHIPPLNISPVKAIDVAHDLHRKLHEALIKFETQYGEKPSTMLMQPNAYKAVMLLVMPKDFSSVPMPIVIQGIPVIVSLELYQAVELVGKPSVVPQSVSVDKWPALGIMERV